VEDKTDGFHFIGTVHVTRRLAQNTYQAFIIKEQTGVLHSEREGYRASVGELALGIESLKQALPEPSINGSSRVSE